MQLQFQHIKYYHLPWKSWLGTVFLIDELQSIASWLIYQRERERERERERGEREGGWGEREKMSIFVYIWEGDQSRLAIPVKKVYLRHAIHYNYINTLFNTRTFHFYFGVLTQKHKCILVTLGIRREFLVYE